MLMLKQDDEMFSVLLSPKTHRVVFFLFQRTFIFIASERPHMCAHTITLTFLLGMIERKITTVMCTETNSMKPKKFDADVQFVDHVMHPLELYFEFWCTLVVGN